MSETPTPRTDAEPPVYDGFPSTVSRESFRKLEKELAAVTKQRDDAQAKLNRAKALIRKITACLERSMRRCRKPTEGK